MNNTESDNTYYYGEHNILFYSFNAILLAVILFLSYGLLSNIQEKSGIERAVEDLKESMAQYYETETSKPTMKPSAAIVTSGPTPTQRPTSTPAPTPTPKPELYLWNNTSVDSHLVSKDISPEFSYGKTTLWPNALLFRATGGGDSSASITYQLQDNYKKLSFSLIPYKISGNAPQFYSDAKGIVYVYDADTGKQLYKTTIKRNTKKKDVSVDIDGVGKIKIEIVCKNSWFAYTVVDELTAVR